MVFRIRAKRAMLWDKGRAQDIGLSLLGIKYSVLGGVGFGWIDFQNESCAVGCVLCAVHGIVLRSMHSSTCVIRGGVEVEGFYCEVT